MKIVTALDQIKNPEVLLFIRQTVELSEPDNIVICNGSENEYSLLCSQLVEAGTFKKLNPGKWPNSYACNPDPSDVARVEDRTFYAVELRLMLDPPTTGLTQEKCDQE